MAGIDYTIPGQIKNVQLESPENAMARAMQLRGLQESAQMNALKMQEYQQQQQEKNALARIYADPNIKYGSAEFFAAIAREAPSSYEKIAAGEEKRQAAEAQRELAASTRQQREAATEKSRFDLEQDRRKEEQAAIDLRLKQFNEAFPAYNIQSEQDVEDRILAMANDEVLGPITTRFGTLGDLIASNKAAYRRNSDIYRKQVAGVSAETILTAIDARKAKAYNDYRTQEIFAGRTPLSREAYEQQTALAAPAAESAAAPAAAPARGDTAGTPVVTEGGRRDGFEYLHPETRRLLQLAATAETDKEKQAYKDAADKIQAAFEEDVKVQRKRTELPQDAQDIANMRAKIRELRKQPATADNLQQINDLLELIKTVKQGKGTKVEVGVKLPEQEKQFEGELGKGQAKKILEDKEKAEDARDMLDTVRIGREILKSGVITGAGADFLVGLNQALKTVGIDFGYAEASANSQAYAANMAQNVGKLIKLFGAGTGLSDADRKYAERMAGGQISLDRTALEKILNIQERASRNVIKRHNERVKGIKTNIPLEVKLDEAAPAPAAAVPMANSKGWKLHTDSQGRRAYVSPDGKQYEEVK